MQKLDVSLDTYFFILKKEVTMLQRVYLYIYFLDIDYAHITSFLIHSLFYAKI